MRFRCFDNLRLFDVVARHLSFSAAADALHLTKGAVSYQMRRLEDELGFAVFERRHRGIALTERGEQLWHVSQVAFGDLEREIERLRESNGTRITIGMSSYFASRWLSPRLMTFTEAHPQVGLRLQPTLELADFRGEHIDMAIRWGRGDWGDARVESLLPLPAIATAGAAIARRIAAEGLAAALPTLTLLHDSEHSRAWSDWCHAAGLPFPGRRNGLVIPDPNVRVQAVIDGQGLALNDALVADELRSGRLVQVSPVALHDYGYYLAWPRGAMQLPALREFFDWIVAEATR